MRQPNHYLIHLISGLEATKDNPNDYMPNIIKTHLWGIFSQTHYLLTSAEWLQELNHNRNLMLILFKFLFQSSPILVTDEKMKIFLQNCLSEFFQDFLFANRDVNEENFFSLMYARRSYLVEFILSDANMRNNMRTALRIVLTKTHLFIKLITCRAGKSLHLLNLSYHDENDRTANDFNFIDYFLLNDNLIVNHQLLEKSARLQIVLNSRLLKSQIKTAIEKLVLSDEWVAIFNQNIDLLIEKNCVPQTIYFDEKNKKFCIIKVIAPTKNANVKYNLDSDKFEIYDPLSPGFVSANNKKRQSSCMFVDITKQKNNGVKARKINALINANTEISQPFTNITNSYQLLPSFESLTLPLTEPSALQVDSSTANVAMTTLQPPTTVDEQVCLVLPPIESLTNPVEIEKPFLPNRRGSFFEIKPRKEQSLPSLSTIEAKELTVSFPRSQSQGIKKHKIGKENQFILPPLSFLLNHEDSTKLHGEKNIDVRLDGESAVNHNHYSL